MYNLKRLNIINQTFKLTNEIVEHVYKILGQYIIYIALSNNVLFTRWGVPFVEQIIINQDEEDPLAEDSTENDNLLVENLQTDPSENIPSKVVSSDIVSKQVVIDFKEPFREDLDVIKPTSSKINKRSTDLSNVSLIKTDETVHIIPDPIKLEDVWKCPEQNCSFSVLEKKR